MMTQSDINNLIANKRKKMVKREIDRQINRYIDRQIDNIDYQQ